MLGAMPMLSFAYWVHDFDPVLVHIYGRIGIHYYGLAYFLSFVAGAVLCVHAARRRRVSIAPERVGDLFMALILGVLIGGRLGHYLLYEGWRSFTEDPFALLRVWEGGMAFHGGFVGVALALFWFSRSEKQSYFQLADLITSVAPLGLFLGRIANFINGELWGKPSTLAWACIFPQSAPYGMPTHLITPRHPSQLYEAVLEGLLLFAWVQLRFWRSDLALRKPGRISGEFVLGYSLARCLCELYREPDAGIQPIFGLSRGTFYSLLLALFGLWLIWHATTRNKSSET